MEVVADKPMKIRMLGYEVVSKAAKSYADSATFWFRSSGSQLVGDLLTALFLK